MYWTLFSFFFFSVKLIANLTLLWWTKQWKIWRTQSTQSLLCPTLHQKGYITGQQSSKKPQTKEEGAEGHSIDLHGDLELHIRGLLMYFGKWSNTEGFSVITQISINLNILKWIAGEKHLFQRMLFWLLGELVTDSLCNIQNLKNGEGSSY